jgi:hypothetical protein
LSVLSRHREGAAKSARAWERRHPAGEFLFHWTETQKEQLADKILDAIR